MNMSHLNSWDNKRQEDFDLTACNVTPSEEKRIAKEMFTVPPESSTAKVAMRM